MRAACWRRRRTQKYAFSLHFPSQSGLKTVLAAGGCGRLQPIKKKSRIRATCADDVTVFMLLVFVQVHYKSFWRKYPMYGWRWFYVPHVVVLAHVQYKSLWRASYVQYYTFSGTPSRLPLGHRVLGSHRQVKHRKAKRKREKQTKNKTKQRINAAVCDRYQVAGTFQRREIDQHPEKRNEGRREKLYSQGVAKIC